MARNWPAMTFTARGTTFHHHITLKSLRGTIRRLKDEGKGPLAPGFARPILPWLIENVLGDSVSSSDIAHIKIKVPLLLNEEK